MLQLKGEIHWDPEIVSFDGRLTLPDGVHGADFYFDFVELVDLNSEEAKQLPSKFMNKEAIINYPEPHNLPSGMTLDDFWTKRFDGEVRCHQQFSKIYINMYLLDENGERVKMEGAHVAMWADFDEDVTNDIDFKCVQRNPFRRFRCRWRPFLSCEVS